MSDFRARAICRDVDPEGFYPVGDDWSGPLNATRAAEAKALCSLCPVRVECLADAIGRGDAWAVLGGTLPDERRGPRGRDLLGELLTAQEPVAV